MLYQSIAAALTNLTGRRLDFFNIGGLAQQRTQDSFTGLWTHYSWREYFIRGGILVTTAIAGYMGAQSCEEEDCMPVLRGLVSAGVGFFASHAVAVLPTIQRRNHIIANISTLNDTISLTLLSLEQQSPSCEALQTFINNVRSAQQSIMEFQSPLQRRGDAVRSLVLQKQGLQELINRLESDLSRLSNSPDDEDVFRILDEINADWANQYEQKSEPQLG